MRRNQSDDPFVNARNEAGALAYFGAVIDIMVTIQYLGQADPPRVAIELPATELVLREVVVEKPENEEENQ